MSAPDPNTPPLREAEAPGPDVPQNSTPAPTNSSKLFKGLASFAKAATPHVTAALGAGGEAAR
jgi:hypothetical protein